MKVATRVPFIDLLNTIVGALLTCNLGKPCILKIYHKFEVLLFTLLLHNGFHFEEALHVKCHYLRYNWLLLCGVWVLQAKQMYLLIRTKTKAGKLYASGRFC